jgi:hypothetical protein
MNAAGACGFHEKTGPVHGPGHVPRRGSAYDSRAEVTARLMSVRLPEVSAT